MNDLLLERVFRKAKWGMLLADGQGRIISINEKCIELLGLKKEAVGNRVVCDVIDFTNSHDFLHDLKEEPAAGFGNQKALSVDLTILKDTEHKFFEVKEGLSESKLSTDQKLQLATSAARIGIWEYYPSSGKLIWNDDMFYIFEMNKAEFKGVYEDWAKCLHPEDLDHANDAVQVALDTGSNFDYSFRIITQSGREKHIKANAKVIQDTQGNPKGMMGTNIDITEEISLRDSLEQQGLNNRLFIEQSPNATAMFNTNMEYLAASAVWVKNNDLEVVDFIGKSHYEVLPETSEKWRSIYSECLLGTEKKGDKELVVGRNGERKYIRWDIRPWYDHNKVIGGILVHVDDITEWMQRMDEKSAVEKILLETQSAARIGSWEVDLTTNVVTWDAITRSIHEVPDGFMPDVATGVNFYKEGASREGISAAIEKSISDGTPWDLDFQLITYEGREIWCRAIGQAELNEKGECIRLYGLFQDINSQKTAERKLKISEVRFKKAFENSAIGMALVSLTGEWLQVNNRLSDMIGYTEEELRQLTFQDLTHPEDLDKDLKNLQRAIDDEIGSYQMQKRYFHKDGSIIWAMMSVALIRDDDHHPVHLVAQIEDITKRVESAKKLTEANEHLEAIALSLSGQNKRLADFAHITTHNLRAPVNNLSALKKMHEMASSDEERDLIFGKFETVIGHLASTLNELMEALIIKEKGEDEISKVSLHSVFDKIAETLTGEIMTSEGMLESDFASFSDVQFNKAYMESIMLNLISNAVKYKAPDRAPRIKVYTEIKNDRRLLHFEDNGLGIDLKKHGNMIFGLYKTFHVHAQAKGVGLFLVKTQVEALGGKIKVSSEPGVGTRFTISFARED